jgi:hypothetical protein
MFVDHDQARLAGQIDERWQLDGSGRVAVVPGGVGGGNEMQSPADAVMIIELDGVESGQDGSLARIAQLPGVLSCSDAGAGSATARVAARESDRVLRRVLSFDGVHVSAVRAEDVADAEEAGW